MGDIFKIFRMVKVQAAGVIVHKGNLVIMCEILQNVIVVGFNGGVFRRNGENELDVPLSAQSDKEFSFVGSAGCCLGSGRGI